MQKLWNRLVEELEADRQVFLALVTESSKGSPGTAQSSLLLTKNGEQTGTIGGGLMEQELLRTGQQALRDGAFDTRLQTLHHQNSNRPDASGLICGGSQSNLLTLVNPTELCVAKSVVESLNSNKPGILSLSPEGLSFEPNRKSTQMLWVERMEKSWSVCFSTFNRRRIAIFGGGHCGAALAHQMESLNYSVSILDPRRDLFTLSSFNQGQIYHSKNFEMAASLIDHPEITFAVVLAPSYPEDVNALSGILRRSFPYIGVMGSPSKIKKIEESLYAMGFDQEDWNRITAPTGIPIESDTPEEIAVSISAQILHEAHKLGLK
jgi:xanthine dehydrogenase accessory factor